ncbi:flavin reductase family protein [Mycobacterium sp. 1274756.6]|uniref:flavin reductase family protein n=1 Tax=Mycobacterium sp. 1274756.6 TaxID=1834076 RepID=UPI0007FE7CE9|nr:flavin reductase family protein [Mycobacterium sp. 1274756.6]OBJ68080.1 hypothetical protein A5643_15060 [Mycobacterium sp. 1274756.6]
MNVPVELEPEEFRRIFGRLPSGVTVITAHGMDGPIGMAANSVTSVSLDPPLLLFCPAKSSSTWPKIRDSGAFCVNLMADHHEGAVRRFAMKGADRFVGVEHTKRPTGLALTDAVAWIECRLEKEIEAGDHTIVIGQAVAAEVANDSTPLVFLGGIYGRFHPTPIGDARNTRI